MEITGIEAIPVAMGVRPLDDGGLSPYVGGQGVVEDEVERVLVRLETEGDVTGWGEFRPTLSPEATVTIVERDLAPEVIGRSVWEIEAFVDEFFFEYLHVQSFLGGVEMAMWDAFGKHTGQPVHRLIGGKCTDSVDLARCLGILPPEESREHAERALELGYDVLKVKAGRDWREDAERLIAMHDAVDGELDLRIDPNQNWSFPDAVRVGARLEDAGVYPQYLEQPIRIDSFGTLDKLRSRLRTPIAANEDTYFPHNLMNMAREDAIDVAVVDHVPAGGILGLKRLAAVGGDLGVSMAHHNAWDLGVKTAAMLHVVSSTPSIDLAPDTVYFAWVDDVIADPHVIEDGSMAVPDEPGLGVTVEEDAVEEYRID
jgi:L-alanine-DL-glutamate epimerase-like enolase superfamily enzyme